MTPSQDGVAVTYAMLQRGRTQWSAEIKYFCDWVYNICGASTGPHSVERGNEALDTGEAGGVAMLQRGRTQWSAEIASLLLLLPQARNTSIAIARVVCIVVMPMLSRGLVIIGLL